MMSGWILMNKRPSMRKAVSALLALCLVCMLIPASAFAAGFPVTVEAESTSGIPGEKVKLAVYMDPNDYPFWSYSMSLTYDSSRLELLAQPDGIVDEAGTAPSVTLSKVSEGGVTIAGTNFTGYFLFAKQKMVTLSFKIKDNAAPGVANVTIASAAYTDDEDPIAIAGENLISGKITVTAPPDTTAPVLTENTNSTDLPTDAELKLVFSESVIPVSGKNIVIRKTSDDSTVATIAADDATQVAVQQETVTINLDNDLEEGSAYYGQVDAGAFKDLAGNGFAGISDLTTWTFATAPAAQQGTVAISIGAVQGKAGDTVVVPVSITEASTGIASYGLQIDFDAEALEAVAVDGTSSGQLFQSTINNRSGFIKAGWVDAAGGTKAIQSGEIMKVQFKIKTEAALGDKPLTVDTSDIMYFTFTDASMQELSKTVTAGKVAVVKPQAEQSESGGGQTQPSQGVNILVNGKAENAGTASTSLVNGRTVTTVAIDGSKLEQRLAAEGERAVITIPVSAQSDVIVGELNGLMVKSMENKQAVVQIQTDKATYTLPAGQLDIQSIAEKVGKDVALEAIKIFIEIAAPANDTVKLVERSAEEGHFTIVAPPLSFAVKAVYGGSTIEVAKFNAYVERTIAIADGVDPDKITTGVVIEEDGTVRHVPTKIFVENGKYYARINSLTNSTYSVVWHPIEFKDVADHWAKDAVNDMGSRLIVSGTDSERFNPEQSITRAEFAAILVRGLGLRLEQGEAPFADVKSSDWYAGAVHTAYAYKLIDGFEDGTFRPEAAITREQAMVITARAMEITALSAKLNDQTSKDPMASFMDAFEAGQWSRIGITKSLQAGIFVGRSGERLAPKELITRAEVAAIVQRLLKYSDLI